MVYPGLNQGGVGGGGLQYRGPGIFHPRGVSICAASAGSDITRCNSAGGIIDLSVGSRHQSRRSAGRGRGRGRSLPQLGRVSADWYILFGPQRSEKTRRTWSGVRGDVGELLANSLSVLGQFLEFSSYLPEHCCNAWLFIFRPLEGALCGGALTCGIFWKGCP